MQNDIKGFFDNINHDLLLRAVRHHVSDRWVVMYIERWLKALVQMSDGSIQKRTRGIPQGGVSSPLLANLLLHYAFDIWCSDTMVKYLCGEPRRSRRRKPETSRRH
ncbi:TPA: reverse transcriptase domain-containing protein [Escherichia coli]|uniref:reverse transcriptase domain-containing protein n=1 Tax=Escherichia coli TaxID=562 RepID=UPI00374048F5